jgi:hypothetical protein
MYTIFTYTTIFSYLVGANEVNIQHSKQGWEVYYDAKIPHATHNVAIKYTLYAQMKMNTSLWLPDCTFEICNETVKCKIRHMKRCC